MLTGAEAQYLTAQKTLSSECRWFLTPCILKLFRHHSSSFSSPFEQHSRSKPFRPKLVLSKICAAMQTNMLHLILLLASRLSATPLSPLDKRSQDPEPYFTGANTPRFRTYKTPDWYVTSSSYSLLPIISPRTTPP